MVPAGAHRPGDGVPGRRRLGVRPAAIGRTGSAPRPDRARVRRHGDLERAVAARAAHPALRRRADRGRSRARHLGDAGDRGPREPAGGALQRRHSQHGPSPPRARHPHHRGRRGGHLRRADHGADRRRARRVGAGPPRGEPLHHHPVVLRDRRPRPLPHHPARGRRESPRRPPGGPRTDRGPAATGGQCDRQRPGGDRLQRPDRLRQSDRGRDPGPGKRRLRPRPGHAAARRRRAPGRHRRLGSHDRRRRCAAPAARQGRHRHRHPAPRDRTHLRDPGRHHGAGSRGPAARAGTARGLRQHGTDQQRHPRHRLRGTGRRERARCGASSASSRRSRPRSRPS